MEILDSYGDSVDALPENAVCRLTNRSPENMMECPSGEFDGECCPEMCNYYAEED